MGSPAVRLAQRAAEEFVRKGERIPVPLGLPPALLQQRACFVTLYENPGRHTRAVFGRPSPAQPTLAHEIIFNTVEAIMRQQRAHIRPADLPYLGYSIAILGPLERILGGSHLNPGRFGLYVLSDRGKSAVILPQRTGIETGEEQISTAYREAGIRAPHESVSLYRFSVTHFD